MHILGIANGSLNGNSEILLKAALKAATNSDPSITTSWIHAPSARIPVDPKPLANSQDVSLGTNPVMQSAPADSSLENLDDRAAVLNAMLDADGIIFSTPIYSHQPAGFLKALTDRILGPFTDASLARKIIEGAKNGDPRFVGKQVDERLLKPRVVGFMAVGGSTHSDHITMALPTLHSFAYPMHMKVVDQVVFQGYAAPGSVLVNPPETTARAAQLGERVASQLGKEFDEAEYLGPEPDGACPFCHLAKIDLFCTKDNTIGCITCGAEGRLVVSEDGVIRPQWNEKSEISCITMAGKTRHVEDLFVTTQQEAQKMQADLELQRQRDYWRSIDIPLAPLPSNCQGQEASRL